MKKTYKKSKVRKLSSMWNVKNGNGLMSFMSGAKLLNQKSFKISKRRKDCLSTDHRGLLELNIYYIVLNAHK